MEGIVEAMDNHTHTNYNLPWPVWNDGCYIWNINDTAEVMHNVYYVLKRKRG